MSQNPNLDRQAAHDRLKALGVVLEGGPKWEYLVHHHSEGKDDATHYDWPAIRKYHMSYRVNYEIKTKAEFEALKASGKPGKYEEPWPDIGYHFGIEQSNGYRFSVGRPADKTGWHVAGLNDKALGLCWEGNWNKVAPPPALWEFGIPIVLDLMRWFTIPVKANIGHREAYDLLGQKRLKTCPGTAWSMDAFRHELSQRLMDSVS